MRNEYFRKKNFHFPLAYESSIVHCLCHLCLQTCFFSTIFVFTTHNGGLRLKMLLTFSLMIEQDWVESGLFFFNVCCFISVFILYKNCEMKAEVNSLFSCEQNSLTYFLQHTANGKCGAAHFLIKHAITCVKKKITCKIKSNAFSYC